MNAQIMTAVEGETGFNFDKWITNHSLQDIKHLFIKHNANTQHTLQLTSTQFSALMTDQQLFQKSYMIPKIMQAMQKKQRIVITEAEEIAMVNARKENEKILQDINSFNTLIKNTNNNKRESEKKINIQFDKIIKALRVRQKELLTKLENIQTNKIKKFEKQLNILKVCGKQYNDLDHKWEQLIHNENIERNNRKQLIVNDANLSIGNAKKLQNENKNIFATVNDKFEAQFEYKSFVDGFGNVFSAMAAPMVSLLDVGVKNAKFDVQCVGGVDDEKKEENEYIYQVEWSSDCKGNEEDDDEKYEWEIKEFGSVPIEIDNLLKNTKYGIRCKLISTKRNVCSLSSDSSQILLFNTKDAEMFEIERGDISLSTSPSVWRYNGKSDALSFMSDKNIIFYGIAVFDCEGTVDVKYKIFKGDNKDNDNNIIAQSKQKSFTKDASTEVPIRFDLDIPININKDTKYTIQLEQKNNGSRSYMIKPGKTTVTIKGVKITFSNASISPNATKVNQGAFPILYCAV